MANGYWVHWILIPLNSVYIDIKLTPAGALGAAVLLLGFVPCEMAYQSPVPRAGPVLYWKRV